MQSRFDPMPDVTHFLGSEHDASFRLFADSISNLAWIAHPDGSIYWYNSRWYEYTGTTPAQMVGWGWQSVHDPATLPVVMDRWKASIATGEPFDMTFPLRGADGVFRPFATRIMPLKSSSGEVLRWFGTNTDISRDLEAATALRESEQRFRTAAQAVNAILWTNNAAGQMVGDQPGWSAFTGQSADEYQGYGWASAVHPDDAQASLEAWQEAVREDRFFSFEHRVRRHDGAFRLCSIRALPVRNQDGSVREWVGVHTDITDERHTQHTLRTTIAALKQQQELVEAAQLAGNVGFWRFQPALDDLYLSSGSRHLLGLPPNADITLAETLARIEPDDAHTIRQALKQAHVGDQYRIEFRTLPSSHSPTRTILGIAQVLTSASEAPYFVGINLDITQQKLASEVLIRTEKLAVAGRLAASIAHEINNPLEAVTNLLYLLLQTPLDHEQREFALTMGSELQRVSQIATHTLRFHRQSTRPVPSSIDTLLDSVLALHEGRIRNASVDVISRFRAAGQVIGFEGELRQVLANLVGNAVDAMTGLPTARRLYLRTRDIPGSSSRFPGPGVLVTVADTGPGIDASVLSRIFEPFFTTKADVGTGLGLWVSSEIVNKHHGRLQVRSSQRARLHGTVFQLFLPLDPGLPSLSSSPPPQASHLLPLKTLTSQSL